MDVYPKEPCGGELEARLWYEFREGVEGTQFIGHVASEASLYQPKAVRVVEGIA